MKVHGQTFASLQFFRIIPAPAGTNRREYGIAGYESIQVGDIIENTSGEYPVCYRVEKVLWEKPYTGEPWELYTMLECVAIHGAELAELKRVFTPTDRFSPMAGKQFVFDCDTRSYRESWVKSVVE